MKYFSELQRSIEQKEGPECFVKGFIESGYETNGISDLEASFVAGCMFFLRHMIFSNRANLSQQL